MTKFILSATQPYTLITPGSPLEELEEFLKHNEFALGVYETISIGASISDSIYSPPVTDLSRKFVLGVATRQDLEVRKSPLPPLRPLH